MRLFQPNRRERRAMMALFTIAMVITILLTAFFHTQVLAGERFMVRAEENRLRPVPIPAPRGTIYDRNGEIVATSVPGFSVNLLPGAAETIQDTLRDLAPFLGLSEERMQRLMTLRNQRPHDLLEITRDATFAQIAALEEQRSAFPNLLIVDWPKRYYPSGAAIGHMIGYVAEISRQELEMPLFRKAGYRQGRLIGKAGIERQYELTLSGRDGARFVESDALGRVVNPRSVVGVMAPEPGQDITLTLDLPLQRYVHEIFPDTMRGSIVAMVPSTGEILALVSHPGFDPNDFVGGIRPSVWQALTEDPARPLLDRSIAALYPPASTWKLATAAAGIERGILNRNTRMPIACTGGLAFAGRFARCWRRSGHGSLDLAGAIEKSCNVYFYQVGIRLGFRDLVEYGTRAGFNTRSGIDLPGESTPIFPTGAEWWRQRFGYAPQPSEVMSLAIGQGPNSQTMLRTAHFYSAIAGNGTAPQPYLVYAPGAGEGPGAIDLGLRADGLQALWDGLLQVILPGGTAWLSALERWPIYGKTGTAQNPHGESHGLFVGFSGPQGGHPEIVVAAIVEHGRSGSDVSPLVAKAINFYLDRKYGHPFDPQPTLLERWETRRKPWGRTDSYEALLTPIARER
jgi:penicillin-binding protein 2